MRTIGVDISDLHAGQADGTTRFTYEIAKRLPSLIPEARWLYFSSGKPSPNYQLPATNPSTSLGVNYQLLTSRWPKYWTQFRFPFDLYRYKPDVLFMPIQQLPYVRPGNMKTVCVVHDLAWMRFGEYFTYKDWLLQHAFTAYVARKADHIIAVSQATADDIAHYYGRGKNVHVAHHGVDHKRFRPPTDEREKQLGWEALKKWQPKLSTPYILYVGQIQPRKNLERLIEAFEAQSGNSQLVLVGAHGWLNKPIYQRATTSPRAAHILMPGRVPEELLPALYWHAEVFTLPSLYEGFGLPVLEAMACGTPTVTSNVSSLPEVAGRAAVLVDPMSAEAIAEGIQKARVERAKLAAAGRQQAAKFSWDRTTEQIASILTSV